MNPRFSLVSALKLGIAISSLCFFSSKSIAAPTARVGFDNTVYTIRAALKTDVEHPAVLGEIEIEAGLGIVPRTLGMITGAFVSALALDPMFGHWGPVVAAGPAALAINGTIESIDLRVGVVHEVDFRADDGGEAITVPLGRAEFLQLFRVIMGSADRARLPNGHSIRGRADMVLVELFRDPAPRLAVRIKDAHQQTHWVELNQMSRSSQGICRNMLRILGIFRK